MKNSRPDPSEHAPYHQQYISLVAGTDVLAVLETQRVQTLQLFAGRSERDGNFRYQPGKWTVKEVVGHMTDTERIFAYRALCIARGERASLPGFEQDDYVRAAGFGDRSLASLVEEFSAVRNATLALFRSLSDEAWLRRGVANNYELTVRAVAFITAGHELHHRKILEECYFPAIPRA